MCGLYDLGVLGEAKVVVGSEVEDAWIGRVGDAEFAKSVAVALLLKFFL